MAINASLIGRLGGGVDVMVSPLVASSDRDWSTVSTVDVPSGETWLIVVHGSGSRTNTLSAASIRLGGETTDVGPGSRSFPVAAAGNFTGPAAVDIDLRSGGYSDTFSIDGQVYTVPLPD